MFPQNKWPEDDLWIKEGKRNFAHWDFQTSELWLGVRDGDFAPLGHLH